MTYTTLSATPLLSPEDLAAARRHISGGGLVVVPTDTVYGIGCLATNAQAVARVLAAKGRGRQMPPPVLVPSVSAMDELCVDIPEAARSLARAFWPGGLTLIVKARPDLGWDLGETGGTLALRMPGHDGLVQLLEETGPLAVTSANLTGHAPATSIDEAVAAFGEKVGLYIDGGPTASGTASSIVDLAHADARVIRLGTLGLEDLSAVAGIPLNVPEVGRP